MAVTIKNIAELAGVSIGTVDRVINNRGRVNAEVEQRIRKIITAVEYTPNRMAKSLALKRRAPKIGVIFHVKSNKFNNEVTEGIKRAETEMADLGLQVIIRSSSDFSVTEQLQYIDELLALDVMALAITPINDPLVIDRIEQLLGEGFPVFCFINDIDTHFPHPFIGPDAYETGAMAAGIFNMMSGGEKQRVAVITPLLKMLGHTERIRGLEETLAARYPHVELTGICEISNDEVEIYKTVKAFLIQHRNITALWHAVSISDGGITAINEMDMLHQVQLVTLDLQSFIIKGLNEGYIAATISQEPYHQGYLTIKTIFDTLLEGSFQPTHRAVIPCEILLRENYHHKIHDNKAVSSRKSPLGI